MCIVVLSLCGVRSGQPAACVVEDLVFVEGGAGGTGTEVFGGFFLDAVVLLLFSSLAAPGSVSCTMVVGVGGAVVGRSCSRAGDGLGDFIGVLVYVGFAAVGVRPDGGGFHEEASGWGLIA